MTYSVFLSYSEKNDKLVSKVYEILKQIRGVELFKFNINLKYGENWDNTIFNVKIPTCDAFIPFLTKEAVNSPAVIEEINHALSFPNKMIIPIVTEDVKINPDHPLYKIWHIKMSDPNKMINKLYWRINELNNQKIQDENKKKAILVMGGIFTFLCIAATFSSEEDK